MAWPRFAVWTAMLMVVCACAYSSRAATLTASLERSLISFGETTILSLTVVGGDADTPPAPPQVPNLAISYLGPSRQVSIVQNDISSTTSYRYIVQPRQVGTYTIPAVRVNVDGQVLNSQPVQLVVARAGSAAATNAAQLAFLRLVLPKTNAYVGEVLVAEAHLYIRQGVQGIQNFNITDFPANGFNIGKMVEGKRSQVQVGGGVYTVVPLLFPLTATKPTATTLGPIVGSVVAQIPSRNRRRDPFFEQFGMRDPFDMLGGTEDREVALNTEGIKVRVFALPTNNVPAAFGGAVGNFTMSASIGPTNVAVGDPITVRVQINGRGALDAVTLPPQPSWREFKVYPAIAKTETSDPLGLQGGKVFEQVIVPERTEIRSVPEFAFSFFDPDQHSYRTLTHPAVGLIVRPGGSLPALSSGSGTPAESQATPDIVHIKPRLGGMAQISVPLVRQGWFLALQVLPISLLAGACFWRARLDNLARNPRLRRKKEVDAIVEAGLRELKAHAAAGAAQDFYALVFRLLQERIGERLDAPASSITEAVIDQQLRRRNLPDTLLSDLEALFQSCNVARYAGAAGQGLHDDFSKLERALQGLEAIPS